MPASLLVDRVQLQRQLVQQGPLLLAPVLGVVLVLRAVRLPSILLRTTVALVAALPAWFALTGWLLPP